MSEAQTHQAMFDIHTACKLETGIKANQCVNEFAYNELLNQKPNVIVNGRLNCKMNSGILDVIIDIGKAIVMSEITGAVSRWLHPGEYNYAKEILDKVTEIEANVEKLIKMTQLVAYQDALNQRRVLVDGLSTVSTAYFARYCEQAMKLPAGSDAAEYEKILVPIVEEWSTKICNGTNVYYVLENLLKTYLTVKMLDKYYPQMYDELAYFSYPWESQSYAFRQVLRDEDLYVILSNLILTRAYFTMHKDDYHLSDIEKYCKIYANFVETYPAVLNFYPVCQIPGAEMAFEDTWTPYSWHNQLQTAKDNKWNLKDGSVRNTVYYNNHKEQYCSIENLQAMSAYYGHAKTLLDILSEATLTDENGAVVSGFKGLNNSNWYIVQGTYDWDIKMLRKNRDKFLVNAVSMARQPITCVREVVCENCNFTSGIVPPQDYNPPMKCTNPGNEVKSCGFYKVGRRGR